MFFKNEETDQMDVWRLTRATQDRPTGGPLSHSQKLGFQASDYLNV